MSTTASRSLTHMVIGNRTEKTLIVEPRSASASSTLSSSAASIGGDGSSTTSSSSSSTISSQPTALVIVSHGLGDSANGWVDTIHQYVSPKLPHVRFVLPTAPEQPVTVNGGMPSNSWYDIEALGREAASRAHEKCKGIERSEKTILSLIEQHRKPRTQAAISAGTPDIPLERVVLMGFSQGAALSLYTGLRMSDRLGGIVAMSGYLPLAPSFSTVNESVKNTPILFCHGDEDNVVPLQWAKDAEANVKRLGIKQAQFRVIEGMAHGAEMEELDIVVSFLKTSLG